VIHDGHANTYAFRCVGRNLTLTLLPPPKLPKSKLGKKNEKSLFMRETQVEKTISKSSRLFALLMVESNTCEGVKPMHPLTQSLFRGFKHVFPNGLPLGLPLLSEVEYQIDLLPGASLPNKLACSCNPNESKVLQ